MDTFNGPGLVPSGKIAGIIRSKLQKLPGLGLPEDATMNQFVEGEYMMAGEYDLFMMDPSDYNLRVMLPRTTPLFECFKRLPPDAPGWARRSWPPSLTPRYARSSKHLWTCPMSIPGGKMPTRR